MVEFIDMAGRNEIYVKKSFPWSFYAMLAREGITCIEIHADSSFLTPLVSVCRQRQAKHQTSAGNAGAVARV